jgi:hypothetical protein
MIPSRRQLLVCLLLVAGTAGTAGCADGTSPPEPTVTTAPSNRAAGGEFTREFAECMRANGVSNFPDPTGEPGQLGPDSGIDPGSSAYLSAINGPCRPLAPPAWIDDGSGSVHGK